MLAQWQLACAFRGVAILGTIDRIDNNKGYSPENCKWSDAKDQGRNIRRVKMSLKKAIEVREKYNDLPCRINILSLAEEYQVSNSTIYLIINNAIWKK